ncbi:hypothetical protein SLS53_000680 [Cytospora paraplurivora]|uniref:Kinase n=1 Tax=Cytospora paraplurivora TaxID=2898453 RepID=A0AAN9UHX8_9PEZI
MPSQKAIPHYSELVEFNYAVAGHDGTLCDTEGELFIKPCTQAEIDFYQSLPLEHSRMQEIVPEFIGSLTLNDTADIQTITEQLPIVAENNLPEEVKGQMIELITERKQGPAKTTCPSSTTAPIPLPLPAPAAVDNVTWIPNASGKIPTDKAVVLMNAACGFKRPNIVDVKLGRRLWADDAPLEKKKRFDKIASETTHQDLGFRIAGMRLYKGSDNPDELDDEGYRIYGKDYGRKEVNKDNVIDAFRSFLYNQRAGIDDDYARAVADAFRRDLELVRDVLEKEESRMYSTSLLFIFEGDGEALKAAIDDQSRSTAASVKAAKPGEGCLSGRSTNRIDSGIGLDDDGEIIFTGQPELDEFSDDSSDESPSPEILKLKLIDFAHAKWTPGQGPDENVLLGVRSLIKIFEELVKEPERPTMAGRKHRRSS